MKSTNVLIKQCLLLAIVIGASLWPSSGLKAQTLTMPEIPILSLTGSVLGWDSEIYPDGRIQVPPESNGPREILVPVFMRNRWTNFQGFPKLIATPIESFKFKITYDGGAFQFLNVQKFGLDPSEDVLAKNFSLSTEDYNDTTYRYYIFGQENSDDKKRGRTVRIIGNGAILPNTDISSDEVKPLLYLKFRVIPKKGINLGQVGKTPIYIAPDTIQYNNWNVVTDSPFKSLWNDPKDGQTYRSSYPENPDLKTILGGTDNSPLTDNLRTEVDYYKVGVIWAHISSATPQFGLKIQRSGIYGDPLESDPILKHIQPEPKNTPTESAALWKIVDPITVDSGAYSDNGMPFKQGTRDVFISNNIAGTRLNNIIIETDQPWLKFTTIPKGPAEKGDVSTPSRYASYVNHSNLQYLDNAILGNSNGGGIRDPQYGETEADKIIRMQVICDPSALANDGLSEATGMHVGYITLRSDNADISPLKLKVSFLYIRPPMEPALDMMNGTRFKGIELILKNNAGFGDSTKLVFGTAYRATVNQDSLFGEFVYGDNNPWPTSGFGARLFPQVYDPNYQGKDTSYHWKDIYPYGLGDFASNDENPWTSSRDIRSITDDSTSIRYCVRFNANQKYPVVLTWDAADFPENSQVFLTDTANGKLFPATDMRKGTNVGGSIYSYTFTDANIKSFVIEYTLPKVYNYVDAYGNKIIKKGWNLLSLPVRPANGVFYNVYKNAINMPYYFNPNQYQQPQDGILVPGLGYFIKYGDVVDCTFAGGFINKIDPAAGDVIKLQPGWNAVGALSVPINFSNFDFIPTNGGTFDKNNTMKKGAWAYRNGSGYEEVSIFDPGLGYWVNVNTTGNYKMVAYDKQVSFANTDKENIVNASQLVRISDNAQNNGKLYISNDRSLDLSSFEMPPLPPAGLFDVRFANNSNVDNSSAPVINMTGVDYPVQISIANPNHNYLVFDAITNNKLGEISKSNNTVTIMAKTPAVRIESESVNEEVFPNPVVNVSTLNVDANSQVYLYDALGNMVSELNQNNGQVRIDAASLVSGQYFVKVVNGDNTTIKAISVVK